MIKFLEIFTATVREHPDRPAVVDRDGTRTTTYAELCSCAFKVNNWLRTHGIGREDVAAIYFPKGLEYIATRIGIIMSGAAWLGLEDIMGRDRIDFAIHDSGCKVVFDMEKWNEAMNMEECREIAEPDPHDLAFMLYTSGSTGYPKGVLQEYGFYDKLTNDGLVLYAPYNEAEPLLSADDMPASFISNVIITLGALGCRGTLHEVSHETIRNVDALAEYFEKNNLHYGCFSTNLLQMIKDDPRFDLKAVFTGGDSSSNLFSEDCDIVNVYASTEAGSICLFRIDKPYDITPAGYNVSNLDIVLLDEKGIPSDEGVICVHLPYFRGYTNEAAHFTEIDGKRYFVGSDWVKRDLSIRNTTGGGGGQNSMIEFVRMLTSTAREHPDRTAIVDRDGTRTTTYAELCSCAFKVNNWLRTHNIGREDVAAIYFPKGLEYIATRIGIIMSGAAWLGLEDIMGKSRIDFAIHDSGCKVVFDMEKWNEAMTMEECREIADPDPHDLASMLYTSGSTGYPKGVMQEYGFYDKLTKFCLEIFTRYSQPEPYIHAEVTPQSFLTGIIQTIGVLGVKGTLHEVSHEMARDIDALAEYFGKNNLRYGGFSPNLLQLIKNDSRFNFKAAFMGGDSVSHLFNESYDMITIYASSEAGPICIFWIDKPYDITPAGYNVSGLDIVLLDEKGRPSDEGIICFSLPYFRGYTNDNKASSFTEINGKKYFVGSDWVNHGKDGLYTVLGRTDDMVKISGNRLSLKGLAAAVKRILQLDFCYVSVIIRNGAKLLAAYYMSDKELDAESANSTLREHLPNFMTIAWFIRIDHVPLNANGKVDAHAFPKPDMSVRTCPYVKPVNSVQETMCGAVKHVLELEGSVGIDDDFFMLGGDSLKAIETVLQCRISGLNVQMIYEGRTVRKISALLEDVKTGREGSGDVPLNVIQLYMMDEIKKNAPVPTLNIPFRINIKPDVDLQEVSRAISEAVKAHPILSSVVVESNGQYVFEQRAEFERAIPVEEMTDEELEAQVNHFVRPFTFDGEPLFRCRIIETPTSKAVLLDICHVVCDGTSAERFIADIAAALKGERLERDNTFGILREEAKYRKSDLFALDMEYFAGVCRGTNWSTLPVQDRITDENEDAEHYEAFSFTRDDTERLSGKYGLGKNGFYIAAAAVALSAYNGSDDVMFTWTWDGRSDAEKINAVGVMIKYLPVALHLTEGLTLSGLFEEISAQIKDGISHGRISYCDEEVFGDDLLLCLLYQGDMYEYIGDEGVIESLEAVPYDALTCDNALNVEILDARTEYGVSLDYNAKLYDEGSMKRFAGMFCRACELMLTMDGSATVSDVKNLL